MVICLLTDILFSKHPEVYSKHLYSSVFLSKGFQPAPLQAQIFFFREMGDWLLDMCFKVCTILSLQDLSVVTSGELYSIFLLAGKAGLLINLKDIQLVLLSYPVYVFEIIHTVCVLTVQFNSKVSQTLWRSRSLVGSSSAIRLLSQQWNEYELLGFVSVQYLDMHYGEQLQHLIWGWKYVKNFQAKSYGLYQNRSLFQLSNPKEHIWVVVSVHQRSLQMRVQWLTSWPLGIRPAKPMSTLYTLCCE